VDEISAEMLKHGKETVAEQLAGLFNMIWQDLKVPEDWKKGVIIKLPKKGSLKYCNNWRGTMRGKSAHYFLHPAKSSLRRLFWYQTVLIN